VAITVDVRQTPVAQPQHRQGEDYEEEGRGARREAQENSRNSLHLSRYCSLSSMGFERTFRLSRYVSRVSNARPAVLEDLERRGAAPFTREEMRESLAGDPASLASRLRALRERVMVTVAHRDLNDLAPLGEVLDTMTALAEESIAAAV